MSSDYSVTDVSDRSEAFSVFNVLYSPMGLTPLPLATKPSPHISRSTQHLLFYSPNLCHIVLAGPAWFSV
jgi:hypothetical protein